MAPARAPGCQPRGERPGPARHVIRFGITKGEYAVEDVTARADGPAVSIRKKRGEEHGRT